MSSAMLRSRNVLTGEKALQFSEERATKTIQRDLGLTRRYFSHNVNIVQEVKGTVPLQ